VEKKKVTKLCKCISYRSRQYFNCKHAWSFILFSSRVCSATNSHIIQYKRTKCTFPKLIF